MLTLFHAAGLAVGGDGGGSADVAARIAALEAGLAAAKAEAAAAKKEARRLGRLNARLEFADFGEVTDSGASAFLATVVEECARIHEALYETFVAYPLEHRLPA